jgi:hypothetical protein
MDSIDMYDMIRKNTDTLKEAKEEIAEIVIGQIEDFSNGNYGLKIMGEWYEVGSFNETTEAREEIEEFAENEEALQETR